MYERKSLGLPEVMKAVQQVIDKIPEGSRPISVAVLDDRGDIICLARTDGSRGFTNEMALRKAYTSAMRRMDTRKLGEHLRKNGWTVSDLGSDYTTIPGGVAIVLPGDETHYGSIGVSGRVASEDEEIALDCLKVIQEALQDP